MPHTHHNHHHGHSHALSHVSKAFYWGIILNSLFVVMEVCIGFLSHSMALVSDAGHNLSDVISLALSLLAFKLSHSRSSSHYTYGFRKTTILAALANAFLLLLAMGGIGYESVLRLQHPHIIEGNTVALVAGIGILINAGTALLFIKGKDKDLNIKGAYLHMAADALVSLGIVIAGIIMLFTGWYWLDGAISLLVLVVILISTWKLFRDGWRLALDGVPDNVNVAEVEKTILSVQGIKSLHHLHIWALSTTETACTAHIVLQQDSTLSQAADIKHALKHKLEHMNITHATIETELESEDCHSKNC